MSGTRPRKPVLFRSSLFLAPAASVFILPSPLAGEGLGVRGPACVAFQTASEIAAYSSKISLYQDRRMWKATKLPAEKCLRCGWKASQFSRVVLMASQRRPASPHPWPEWH
jgi:hypothetical protein